MFLLFGLLFLALLGGVVVVSLMGVANALGNKRNLIAGVCAIPAVLIVGLLGAGVLYGDWKAEAHPDEVYRSVFDTVPPPTITALQGYRDDDELSAIYLQFNAPPPVVATLLKGKFSLSATAVPGDWKSLPSWFDTSLTPTTRVYRKNAVPWNQDAVLFYDPVRGRVRFYSS